MSLTQNGTDRRLPRLLALVPYFLAHPGISVQAAAAELGVAEKDLRRDIDLLTLCGLPGYGPGDLIDVNFDRLDESGEVEVWFDANLDRPVRFNAREALSLVVALQTLADTPGLVDRELVTRTLAKIEAAYGKPVDDRTMALSLDRVVRVTPLLHKSVEESRALRLSYYTAARDEKTERTVDPLQVLTVDGRTYLQAWCRQAEGIRLFRADRIDDAVLLDEPAKPPADLEIPELAEGVYRPAADHLQVELLLAPSYAWVADYYVAEEVTAQQDAIRVRLRVADTGWVRGLVLGAGGEVRVVAPTELATEIHDEARLALAAYDLAQP
jgi:proteasome accessory factor C